MSVRSFLLSLALASAAFSTVGQGDSFVFDVGEYGDNLQLLRGGLVFEASCLIEKVQEGTSVGLHLQ
jgi:hypothetical protein